MRVFITGATGFIGSAIVPELLSAGHKVVGLARNDAAAETVTRLGGEPHLGDLSDSESIADAARASDGVIHTAFVHDFTNLQASGEIDRHVIEAFGVALAGSGKPLVVTSTNAHLALGRLGIEDDAPDPHSAVGYRIPTEVATLALASRNVRACLVRLPPSVHGDGDHAFLPLVINHARQKGLSAFVGEGTNRWPAVHRLDAAHLYRLALENGSAGTRYHAMADEGVPFREIATVIGKRLNIPVVGISPGKGATDHFGWLTHFVAMDCPASSAQTQLQLGWKPTQPGLLADLDNRRYFES